MFLNFKFCLLPMFLFSTALLLCTRETPVTIQPLNGNCVGTLKTSNGQPVQGGTVFLIPGNYEPGPSTIDNGIDSTTSDEYGRYAFGEAKSGLYNVLAKADNLVAYHKAIAIQENDPVNLENEILKTPGSLSGNIQLQGKSDNSSAIILFIGTNRFATARDSSGSFSINGLAPGSYLMRVLSSETGFAKAETTVTVVSGTNTTLPEIELKKKQSVSVEDLRVQYNPAMIMATLSWKIPDTTGISGYNIYCNRALHPTPIAKVDKSYSQMRFDVISYPDSLLIYSIATVDKNGIEGLGISAEPVRKVSSITLVKTIVHRPKNNPENPQASNSFGLWVSIDQKGFFYNNYRDGIVKIDSNGIDVADFHEPDLTFFGRLQTDNQDNGYVMISDTNIGVRIVKLNSELKKTGVIDPVIDSGYYIDNFVVRNDGNLLCIGKCEDTLTKVFQFSPDLRCVEKHFVSELFNIFESCNTESGITINCQGGIKCCDNNLNILSDIDRYAFASDYLGNYVDTSLYDKSSPWGGTIGPANIFETRFLGKGDSLGTIRVTQSVLYIFFDNNKQVLGRMIFDQLTYGVFDNKGNLFLFERSSDLSGPMDIIYKYSLNGLLKKSNN